MNKTKRVALVYNIREACLQTAIKESGDGPTIRKRAHEFADYLIKQADTPKRLRLTAKRLGA